MDFFKYPSIESFHHKAKAGKKYFVGSKTYDIKPKLHGTNAGIVFHPRDGVYAQSRKRVITVDSDNMQFAKFVDELGVENIYNETNDVVVLYGEWAGQGIQSKDAITMIDRKIFAPFALVTYDGMDHEAVKIVTDPDDLRSFMNGTSLGNHPDVVVIDRIGTIDIDFNGNADHLQEVADKLNEMIEIYEKIDEWVEHVFGVEGPGEGFVVTPQTNDFDLYYRWSFKTKTTTHSVNKSSKSNVVKAEPSSDVVNFVDRFVTDARLEQAVSELGGDDEMDMKKMGEFLKWMGQDIKKESVDELEVSGLEWKDVSKLITNKSRMWFMGRYQ